MQQFIFAALFLFVVLVIAIMMILDWVARRQAKDAPILATPIISAKNLVTSQYVEAIFYNGENRADVLDWVAQGGRYDVSNILDSLLLGDSAFEKNVYVVRLMSHKPAEGPWRNGIATNPFYTLFTVPEAEFDKEYELLHWRLLEMVSAGE